MSDRKNTHKKERNIIFITTQNHNTTQTERKRQKITKTKKQQKKDTVRRVRGKRIHTLFCFMRKRSEKQFYQ